MACPAGALTESGTGDQLYQQQLYSVQNLDASAEHEVVLENTGNSGDWLDLDYLVVSWTLAEYVPLLSCLAAFRKAMACGSDFLVLQSALLSPTDIDDSGGLVTYNPADAGLTNSTADWQTSSWVTQYTFNQTFHATTHQGDEVRIPFNGSSIQVRFGLSSSFTDLRGS